MKGRPKKPSAIKILEGNRSKVAKADLTPDLQGIGRPRLPLHLSELERRLWADVVASLPVSLLTRADEPVLERMAVAWAEFRDVQAAIRTTSRLIKTAQGPMRNPLLVVREKAQREMHLAGEVLGLSPVSRARLAAVDTAEDDPMALLLGSDMDPSGAWTTGKTKQ